MHYFYNKIFSWLSDVCFGLSIFLSLSCNLLPTITADNQEYTASVIIITSRHGVSSQKTHTFNNNLQTVLTATLRALTLHLISQSFSVVAEPRVEHRCLEQCLCTVPVIALTSAGVQQEVESSKLGAGQQSSNDYLPSVREDGVMQAYKP